MRLSNRPWYARPGACLVMTMLLAACTPSGLGIPNPGAAAGHPLLVEVYYNSPRAGQGDEYVRLYNPTAQAVDLSGWRLRSGGWEAVFPDGAGLQPGAHLYAAREAAAFAPLLGRAPDYEYGASTDPAVPRMQLAGTAAPELADQGAEVLLLDPAGQVVDAVVYGRATYTGPGWKGGPVFGTEQGEVLDRARDERTVGPGGGGHYLPDTDTWADWKQGRAWKDLRVLRPGQTFAPLPTFAVRGSVTAYASPDSSFMVLKRMLEQARTSVDLNLYDLHHPLLVQDVQAAARRGVRVRVLLEGSQRDGLFADQKWAAAEMARAGAQVRFLTKDPAAGVVGRYWLNHAKYGVVDGIRAFVQSENWARHGVPADPRFGNRGWGALVEDRDLANYLTTLFEHDWDTRFAEVRPYDRNDPRWNPPAGYTPPPAIDPAEPKSYPRPFPTLTLGNVLITPVLAPDHTFLGNNAIIGMMRSARRSLYVEQQYIHLHWGFATSGSPERTPNLYLEEIIAAARRGVRVRVLLGDHTLDPQNPKDNEKTVAYINAIARAERLDMEARIVRSSLLGLDKVHNKGVVADQTRVLVSSINWSNASPTYNREVGLILEHPRLGLYFSDIFFYDWHNGEPAGWPLLTEVAPGRFAEVHNPTQRPWDLGGWRLQEGGGARWTFPAGTRLEPGQTMVVARDRQDHELQFRQPAALEAPGAFPAAPGAGALSLVRPDGEEMDAVAWGGGRPGWAGIPGADQVLCRPDPGRDTNTPLDFQAARPSPGVAGCATAGG